MIMGAICAAMAVSLFAILALRHGEPSGEESSSIKRLTDQEITDALTQVPRNVTPTEYIATSESDLARQYFHNHGHPGDLYRCLKHYNRFDAYRGNMQWPFEDQENKKIVLNGDGENEVGLLKLVCGGYQRLRPGARTAMARGACRFQHACRHAAQQGLR